MLLMTTTSQTCYRPMSCLLPTSPTLPHTSYCTRNLNQRSPALRRPCSSGFFESMFSFKIGAFGLGTWGTVSKNGKSVALGWIIWKLAGKHRFSMFFPSKLRLSCRVPLICFKRGSKIWTKIICLDFVFGLSSNFVWIKQLRSIPNSLVAWDGFLRDH